MDVGLESDGGRLGCPGPGHRGDLSVQRALPEHGRAAVPHPCDPARGAWIPGVIDPSCLGSSQIDGRTLMDLYRELGLNLQPAVNAVEAGITEVWNLLVSGQLIPEVSPRRQRVGEDRQARRPPDGRDAIPDRQRPTANEDRARTGFTAEAGTPFRERCLDGLTTNWAFPARSVIFEDREFPSRVARDPARPAPRPPHGGAIWL
jgi:hypothetical protein